MSERVIIKPGSIILWFKPTLWQRLFGRKKEYEYNRASITLREMTEEEYSNQLDWYRNYMMKNQNASSRRTREYVSYLQRWFGPVDCDGWQDFTSRFAMHQLPMPMNVYFG